MALIVERHEREGGAHRGVLGAGVTGIQVFKVSPGRRYNMIISGNTGGTYDAGYYLFSAEDDVVDGLVRRWLPDVEGVTDELKNFVSCIGMKELGINITVASSTDILVEIRECKE